MLNQTLMKISSQHQTNYTEQQKFDDEFVFIDKSMVGCYIAVFVKRNLTARIKTMSFQNCKVKTGVYGTTGNKGAVCIRFQIDNQTFMAINCHLVSGRRREGQRNEMIGKIFENAFEGHLKDRGMAVENHDQVILMGDLNFRINALTREQVLQHIYNDQCDLILKEDDLIISFQNFNQNRKQQLENRHLDMFFRQFQEGKIKFRPTYKFDIRSNQYDSSKKQRVPAFCDRILWKRNENIEQLLYDSVPEVDFTDHKPVIAHFVLHSESKKCMRKAKTEQLLQQINVI